MRREKTSNELRCLCSRHPLLATYGLTSDGELYIHVKIFKQRRIFGEIVVTAGVVSLHCRECLRWHKVVIRQPNQPLLIEQPEAPIVLADA